MSTLVNSLRSARSDHASGTLSRPRDDGSVVVSIRLGVGMAIAVVGQSDAHDARSAKTPPEPDMPPQTLGSRVDRLEQQMDGLAHVPERLDRLESQVLQLRDEMRSEFSAVRSELGAAIRASEENTLRTLRGDIHAGDEETRRTLREEIRAGDEETRRTLRDEIRAGDEETRRVLREEIRTGDEETRRALREEIRTGDEETRQVLREEIGALGVQMRALHEDVIGRLSVIQEGQTARGSSRRGKKRR